jgi:hypothetical protein
MKPLLACAVAALAAIFVSSPPNVVQADGIVIVGDSARVHRVRPDHDWRWSGWDRMRSHHRDLFDRNFRVRAFAHHDRWRVHGGRIRPGFAFQVRPDDNWRRARWNEMRRQHTMDGRLSGRNFRGNRAVTHRDRNHVQDHRDLPSLTFQAGPARDWQWDRQDGMRRHQATNRQDLVDRRFGDRRFGQHHDLRRGNEDRDRRGLASFRATVLGESGHVQRVPSWDGWEGIRSHSRGVHAGFFDRDLGDRRFGQHRGRAHVHDHRNRLGHTLSSTRLNAQGFASVTTKSTELSPMRIAPSTRSQRGPLASQPGGSLFLGESSR